MKQVCSKSGKAFTLIELLVVIAIIAVLFSMLLASLGQSKDYAHRIKCAGNMKQIGIAAISYQSNNGEYQPPVRLKWGGYDCNWYGNLEFMESLTGRRFEPMPGNPVRTYTNNTGTEGLGCPRATLYLKAPDNFYPIYNTYIANGYGFGNIWASANAAYFMPQVKLPSRKISYLEGSNYYASSVSVFNPAAANGYWQLEENSGISYRHQNRTSANALYFDGHVDKITYKDLLANTAELLDAFN